LAARLLARHVCSHQDRFIADIREAELFEIGDRARLFGIAAIGQVEDANMPGGCVSQELYCAGYRRSFRAITPVCPP
jgi:hypothetical protein